MKKLLVCAMATVLALLFAGCALFRHNKTEPSVTINPVKTSGTTVTSTPESTFQVTRTEAPATETEKPPIQATPAPDSKKGVIMYVTGEKVNVRENGATSAQKVASLDWGTAVIAFETKGDWTYICFNNDQYGYIATKYLSETKPTKATPQPTVKTPAPQNETGDGSFDLPEDVI